MTVLFINPNSTRSMTEAMVQAAQAAVPEVTFEGWTSHDGPPSIQGEADGRAATPPLLDLIRKADAQQVDGIVIGCFDDTALAEAARLASCPVIGLGQASFHYAALRNWRFSVVTTMPAAIPVIVDNIESFGLTGFLSKVRAANVPVLDLEDKPDVSERLVVDEAQEAERSDAVDTLVLGCAGMVALTASVQAVARLPVLDPVVIAARSMRWLT